MKIYDSVHGFIHLNSIESALVDTTVFQRLHQIHQLGITYFIYPGATHSRFEHSLGTMHIATKIFDQVSSTDQKSYWRQIIRMASLCHDLGHLPFSHVAEKELLGPLGHEEWTLKIIESSFLKEIWNELEKLYPDYPIVEPIAKLSLGEEKFLQIRPKSHFSPLEQIYSEIITGDFFGADRIDYLLRDARATGLNYGLFDYSQLIEMLEIQEKGNQLTLAVKKNGIDACEALIIARHFMHRRVYHHPASKAYSFHLSRFMKKFYNHPKYFQSVENYLEMSEPEILYFLEKARKNSQHLGHFEASCLLDRTKRFQVISLNSDISEETLLTFKKENQIPETHIHWELKGNISLKEPFSLRGFSQFELPELKKNWLFLSPQYQTQISLLNQQFDDTF